MEEYVSNMRRILREFKKTGAKIIYATTTAVLDKKKFLSGPMSPAHDNEDMIHPNEEGIKRLGAAVANIIKAQLFEEEYHTVSQEMLYTKLDEKTVQ